MKTHYNATMIGLLSAIACLIILYVLHRLDLLFGTLLIGIIILLAYTAIILIVDIRQTGNSNK